MNFSTYKKDLSYFPDDVPLTKETIKRAYPALGGAGTGWIYMQAFLKRDGMQMRVDKDLTDDLRESDFQSFELDDIAWPKKAIEFYFEDPQLPTLVLAVVSAQDILDYFGPMPLRHSGRRIMAAMEDSTGRLHGINLYDTNWNDLLREPDKIPAQPDTLTLSEQENQVLAYMTNLCIKVLAYASLPRYRATPVTQVTRKMGGKIGFKNRPRVPQTRVAYMPTLHSPHVAPRSAGPKGTGTFNGRRGYFRFFKHDRFVNMKGKWIYVAPIRAVSDSKLVAIVRKVS